MIPIKIIYPRNKLNTNLAVISSLDHIFITSLKVTWTRERNTLLHQKWVKILKILFVYDVRWSLQAFVRSLLGFRMDLIGSINDRTWPFLLPKPDAIYDITSIKFGKLIMFRSFIELSDAGFNQERQFPSNQFNASIPVSRRQVTWPQAVDSLMAFQLFLRRRQIIETQLCRCPKLDESIFSKQSAWVHPWYSCVVL